MCSWPLVLQPLNARQFFSMTNVRKSFIAQGGLGAKRLANEGWQSKHESEYETIKGMSVDVYK